MSALQPLETSLNDLFVKKAPPLPDNGKKALVQYLPIINLVFGVISLLLAFSLYHTAHLFNGAAAYVNNLSQYYGGQKVVTDHFTFVVWLAIAMLAVEGLLYVLAYSPLKAHKKSGWDLTFYALLVNVAYGVIAAFTYYGGMGRLFGALLTSVIGGYLLFQIRASYLKAPAATTSKA